MKASWAQILGVLIGLTGVLIAAYVNFYAPPKKVAVIKEITLPSAQTQSTSFRLVKPKRVPSEEELKKAIEIIDRSYGLKDAKVEGEPIVVSLYAPESEQLVLGYEATSAEASTSALEVLDLSGPNMQSLYHREGEEFEYYPISSGEGTVANNYLLVEERTGATGNYLHLSFLEFDGFGKMKEFYSLPDLFNSNLYLLHDKLILEKEHQYFEMVRDKSTVRLADYDLKNRLGFNVLSYGFQNGKWYIKHNDEVFPLSDKGLSLSVGEEAFLLSDPASEKISVRTLSEGPAIEYVQGPPVHIRTIKEGNGTIHFLSDSDGVPEFSLPIEVISAKK